VAETIDVIATRLRTEYPMPQYTHDGNAQVAMTQAQYDEWIANQAGSVRQAQLDAEAEAIRLNIRKQVSAGLAQMESNYTIMQGGNASAAEQRRVATETARFVYWMAQALVDKGIIERV
jgi:hypothetical protein